MKYFPAGLASGALCLLLFASCAQTPSAQDGESLAVTKGCMACHSTDGSVKIGPTWKGLYGSQVSLSDGSTVTADEAYIEQSILEPNATIVAGYSPFSMPDVELSPSETRVLIAYIKSLK